MQPRGVKRTAAETRDSIKLGGVDLWNLRGVLAFKGTDTRTTHVVVEFLRRFPAMVITAFENTEYRRGFMSHLYNAVCFVNTWDGFTRFLCTFVQDAGEPCYFVPNTGVGAAVTKLRANVEHMERCMKVTIESCTTLAESLVGSLADAARVIRDAFMTLGELDETEHVVFPAPMTVAMIAKRLREQEVVKLFTAAFLEKMLAAHIHASGAIYAVVWGAPVNISGPGVVACGFDETAGHGVPILVFNAGDPFFPFLSVSLRHLVRAPSHDAGSYQIAWVGGKTVVSFNLSEPNSV